MANDLIVDEEGTYAPEDQNDREKRLVRWVMDRLDEWRRHRDTNYKDKWDEYYRLWRGIWAQEDKTRNTERSRIISPALQQAIEATVAEFEEATFGRKNWLDIEDDVMDEEKRDVISLRDRFIEDLEKHGTPYSISESFLNGALYGTGVSKIVVEDAITKAPYAEMVEGTVDLKRPAMKEERKVAVKLVPVAPEDFIIDPNARWPDGIDSCLGCAHEYFAERYKIEAGMKAGYYKDVNIGSSTDDRDFGSKGETKPQSSRDSVKIIEYTGLVPESLLPIKASEGEEVVDLFPKKDGDEEEKDERNYYREDRMVEALVTIANGEVLLKEVKNPYLMNDRPFIAYPHDLVPGKFWGRGVSEKGYNAQKALDAELRSRLDARALITHPMMGMDATKIPKGFKFSVGPGKSLLSIGPPQQVYTPMNFGNMDQATFTEAAEWERMIQMGTGAMDSATSIAGNARNNTASGMSMMMSGMIKRSKRALANINRLYLDKGLQKMLWRYMQFDPERYPVSDYKFKIKTSLGIMAREFEQTQFINLLSVTPPDSPMFSLMVKGIFDNSSLSNKEELVAIADQMLQSQMNPEPDPMQQEAMMLDMEQKKKVLEKLDSEIVKNLKQGSSYLSAEEQANMEILQGKINAEIAAMNRGEPEKDIDINDFTEAMQAFVEQQTRITNQGLGQTQNQIGSMNENMQSLIEQLSKPARIERDENGRVIGVARQ